MEIAVIIVRILVGALFLLYHIFIDPSGLPIAIPLLAANLFLAYACRKHYAVLLSRKIT